MPKTCSDYATEEEIEFFKHVPTVCNESHYLAGNIGKGIIRKKHSQKNDHSKER